MTEIQTVNCKMQLSMSHHLNRSPSPSLPQWGRERGWGLIFALCILSFELAFAQQNNLPLNRELNLSVERAIGKNDSTLIFTAFRPLIGSQSYTISEVCNFRGLNWDGNICTRELVMKKGFGTWLKTHLFYDNFLVVNDTADKFRLTIDPLFNFELGADLETLNEKLYKNTRGLMVRGDIGNDFSFETSFYENQATFAQYIDDFNNAFLVVPGQGRWKKFKVNGYDYAMASGNFSYSPGKHFNLQAGHGKHFVGDGYRSLLLSDNAFNYPYARITTTFGKIQYTNLYTLFMNLNYGGVNAPAFTERLFQRKAGSFQQLSYSPHKRVQLGLFQGMIWEATDEKNEQHLNFNYFNPVIGVNSMVYSLGHESNNVLLGATLKFQATRRFSVYGQYMLDDNSGLSQSIYDKQGFQGGMKYLDMFGLRNLHLQLEYNQVRPYAYTSFWPEQSYTHYNQALAHPLGANFSETVAILNYRYAGLFTELKLVQAAIGRDSSGRYYGNNIFRSDASAFYGTASESNTQNQGISSTLKIIDFKVGYIINPCTNMNALMGVTVRTENNAVLNSNTVLVYFGFRTSLTNVYWDF